MRRYLNEIIEFLQKDGTIDNLFPILKDYSDFAGVSSGHYFHQDLLVANFIHKNSPNRHVDIGSRIDGFVAHVAAFRKVEVFDIRNFESSPHENIKFINDDLMFPALKYKNYTDSISCLHALEHFGLGRYGDNIDPIGHIIGFENMVNMLKIGGRMYISFPIASIETVLFNAHRIFHPTSIFYWSEVSQRLELESFDFVDDKGDLHRNLDPFNLQFRMNFSCGIYTFKKIN